MVNGFTGGVRKTTLIFWRLKKGENGLKRTKKYDGNLIFYTVNINCSMGVQFLIHP